MLQSLIRHVLPGTCLLCDGALPPTAPVDVCRFCIESLPWNELACGRCAEPLDAAVTGWCTQCRRRPPPFARALAPLRYEGPARTWVRRLKDRAGMVEGRILGTLLADAAEAFYRDASGNTPAALVPVPLTVRRLARRGHNQAIALARPVAARLNLPLHRLSVWRRHPGPDQRGLGRTERLVNPGGSFRSRRVWNDSPCIAIVDDVMTTGATAAALAETLLAAGAGEVHVLCAARTARQKPAMLPRT